MVPCGELHGQCSVSAGILDIRQRTYLRNMVLLELSQLPQAFCLTVPVPVPGSVAILTQALLVLLNLSVGASQPNGG